MWAERWGNACHQTCGTDRVELITAHCQQLQGSVTAQRKTFFGSFFAFPIVSQSAGAIGLMRKASVLPLSFLSSPSKHRSCFPRGTIHQMFLRASAESTEKEALLSVPFLPVLSTGKTQQVCCNHPRQPCHRLHSCGSGSVIVKERMNQSCFCLRWQLQGYR